MNYIKHTVAAHERLRAQPEASPHHVALYWALFFAWNAEYFGNGFDLDHTAIRQAAHIGNERTYRATLRDLDAWGLLTYQPSQSRHQPSRCYLTNLSGAKVPPVKSSTQGKSAPDEHSLSGAEVPPVEGLSGAKVPEDSLVVQTSFQTVVPNVSDDPPKKIGERFAGEGLSEAQVLDNTADYAEPVAALGVATKKKVAPKQKGVGQGAQAEISPAEPRPPRRIPLPELPFSQSAIASPEAFAAAFQGSDYELADLRHYHQLVATWRDKKTGQEPLRRDWVATAKRFMLNDAADNRLKLAPNVQHHPANPAPATTGIPASGYRSSRWD
ncbi:hypothetical protein [Hymenobacter sp. BT559]|uniref:hypothetical protein n=1 Tax=Hymenobacter sp. BT559 TaxID=2795729 RepID=UPI0018EC2E41|nr:hypothetical protein [Hymenobacter sp. BT559]MBJ6146373.1 hypothetical protein [Hymenobacter sp. BT559]